MIILIWKYIAIFLIHEMHEIGIRFQNIARIWLLFLKSRIALFRGDLGLFD